MTDLSRRSLFGLAAAAASAPSLPKPALAPVSGLTFRIIGDRDYRTGLEYGTSPAKQRPFLTAFEDLVINGDPNSRPRQYDGLLRR